MHNVGVGWICERCSAQLRPGSSSASKLLVSTCEPRRYQRKTRFREILPKQAPSADFRAASEPPPAPPERTTGRPKAKPKPKPKPASSPNPQHVQPKLSQFFGAPSAGSARQAPAVPQSLLKASRCPPSLSLKLPAHP